MLRFEFVRARRGVLKRFRGHAIGRTRFSGDAVAVVPPFAQVNELAALATEGAPRVLVTGKFRGCATDGAGDFHMRERTEFRGLEAKTKAEGDAFLHNMQAEAFVRAREA